MPHADARRLPTPWLTAYTLLVLGGNGYVLRLLARDAPQIPMRRAVAAGPGVQADPPPGGAGEWPFVSVIVPARNEERNLPNLLPSLLNLSYPPARLEVIVVDDQSEDRTPEILAEFAAAYPQLRVVRGASLPDGWKGKPWAMQQGAEAAHGEWLLFTDADTVHGPDSLASTISAAIELDADLFTIGTELVLGGPAERLIMPVVHLGILMFYQPSAVNDPENPTAIANGQYLLFRRQTWDEIGGAERVRNDIAEDLELGRLVKREGYRLYLADGRGIVRVRMYQDFADVWQGWRKNVLLALRKQPAMGTLQLATLAGALTPFVLLGLYGGRFLRDGRPANRASLALVGAQVGTLLLVKRRIDAILGVPVGWTFTFPIGLLLLAAILLDSLRLLVNGRGVTWKGRSYTA
ncbi:MAG: glycosyltransferase [Chloroflexia bacterium]